MAMVRMREQFQTSQLCQYHSCNQAPECFGLAPRGMYDPAFLDVLPRLASSCRTSSITTSSPSAYYYLSRPASFFSYSQTLTRAAWNATPRLQTVQRIDVQPLHDREEKRERDSVLFIQCCQNYVYHKCSHNQRRERASLQRWGERCM